jgi:hypothetical protein
MKHVENRVSGIENKVEELNQSMTMGNIMKTWME